MKKLIAQRPILYHGRNYRRGETLPAGDETMTSAWLRAGSAAWEDEERYEDIIPPAPGMPADGELPELAPAPARTAGKGRKK